MNYSEKLRDPRWQRKRLEIMNRDSFHCLCCNHSVSKPLNVHHLYYEKGFDPWEYDDDSLVTLCDDCHEIIHKDLVKLSAIIAFKILNREIDCTELKFIKK
jgi:5-methylcytosine-specific restriction endonuclease McrA